MRAKTSVQDREDGSLWRHGVVVELRRGAVAEGTMQSRDGRGGSVAGELLQNEECVYEGRRTQLGAGSTTESR